MQHALDREICELCEIPWQALSTLRIDKGTTAAVRMFWGSSFGPRYLSISEYIRITHQTHQAPDLLVSRLGPRFITHHLRSARYGKSTCVHSPNHQIIWIACLRWWKCWNHLEPILSATIIIWWPPSPRYFLLSGNGWWNIIHNRFIWFLSSSFTREKVAILNYVKQIEQAFKLWGWTIT